MTNANQDYDYIAAGFDPFLNRSIDGNSQANLDVLPVAQSSEVNYDQQQVTGSLGNTLTVGNIGIDGVTGRISIFDENNNEVLRLGELDD